MIVRDGDMTFALQEGVGFGFNLKQISKVSIETAARVYGGPKDELFVTIVNHGHATSMTLSRAEALQLFSDSPWIKAVPK